MRQKTPPSLARIELPNPVIFDRYVDEHFFLNVDQYRARPESKALDTDFLYIPKRKRASASILSPRCATTGQRYVIALWS